MTEVATKKTVLVGEVNPYGGDEYYALYPAPDGCSGHRLCYLVLGMDPDAYLEAFGRVNLCSGKWSVPAARMRAQSQREHSGNCGARWVLLGAKVCQAWQVPFIPLEVSGGGTVLCLPHPSGRNLLWNEPGMIGRVRAVVASFAPEVASELGVAGE